MNRLYYSKNLKKFLQDDPNRILSELTNNQYGLEEI